MGRIELWVGNWDLRSRLALSLTHCVMSMASVSLWPCFLCSKTRPWLTCWLEPIVALDNTQAPGTVGQTLTLGGSHLSPPPSLPAPPGLSS